MSDQDKGGRAFLVVDGKVYEGTIATECGYALIVTAGQTAGANHPPWPA